MVRLRSQRETILEGDQMDMPRRSRHMKAEIAWTCQSQCRRRTGRKRGKKHMNVYVRDSDECSAKVSDNDSFKTCVSTIGDDEVVKCEAMNRVLRVHLVRCDHMIKLDCNKKDNVAKSSKKSRKASRMYKKIHTITVCSSAKVRKTGNSRKHRPSKHSSSTLPLTYDSFALDSVQEGLNVSGSSKLQDLNSSVVQTKCTIINKNKSGDKYGRKKRNSQEKDNESTISKHPWSVDTEKLDILEHSSIFNAHKEDERIAVISNNVQKSNHESTQLLNEKHIEDCKDESPGMERKPSNIEHKAKKRLPIITKDDILPKGTIKITRTKEKLLVEFDPKQRMSNNNELPDIHLNESKPQTSNISTMDKTVVSRNKEHSALQCRKNSNFDFGCCDTANNNTENTEIKKPIYLCVCSTDEAEHLSQNVEDDFIEDGTFPDGIFENTKGKSVGSPNSPEKAEYSLAPVPEPSSVSKLTVDNLEKFTKIVDTHSEEETFKKLEEYIRQTNRVKVVEIEEAKTGDKLVTKGIQALDNNSNVLRKKRKFKELDPENSGYINAKRIKLDKEYVFEHMTKYMNNTRASTSPSNCASSVLSITAESIESFSSGRSVKGCIEEELNYSVGKSDTLPEHKTMEILETETSNKDRITVAVPRIKSNPVETSKANQQDLNQIHCKSDTIRSVVYENHVTENYQPSQELATGILENKSEQDDEEDGDSISLSASMNFSEDDDFDESNKCCIMGDDIFKTYVKNTKSEFDQMYESSKTKEEDNGWVENREQHELTKISVSTAVQSSLKTGVVANSSTTKPSALFSNVRNIPTASPLARETTNKIISDKKTVVSKIRKENIANDSKKTRIPITYSSIAINKESTNSENKVAITTPHFTVTNKISAVERNLNLTFRGFCFAKLKYNFCRKETCDYNHDFSRLIEGICSRQKQHVVDVIQFVVSREFKHFIPLLCPKFLLEVNNVEVLLRVFKILSDVNYLTENIISGIVKQLMNLNVPLKLIVLQLIPLANNNYHYLNYISREVENHIKSGQYWETLRGLVLAGVPNLRIVRRIVLECITSQKGSAEDLDKLRLKAEDVNKNLICKLTVEQRCQIGAHILTNFENLLKLKCSSPMGPFVIASPDKEFSNSFVQEKTPKDKLPSTSVEVQPPENVIYKANERRDDSNSESDPSFGLRAIDGLKQPSSALGKVKFWKFYLTVKSLEEGLNHNDYEHVISILKTAKQDQASLFSRTCYNILCKEVKRSQHHLSQIITLTVRTGTTVLLDKILIDVAISILARLADEGFWVLAYRLLKDINIILQMEMKSGRFDATVIILLAQIYLANQRPVKALSLLRQSKLIYTHRKRWIVGNTADDDGPRAKTLALLLHSLCKTSPDHAFFLFEFLAIDQPSNAYPVDLTRLANEVVSVILSKGDSKLIISIGRLIDRYDFTLNTITYRALTAMLVQRDLDLAKQLHQAAIALNIYSKPKLESTATFVIIKCDLSEEEMYLVILDLLHRLLLTVGHCVDHLKPGAFRVYLVHEVIPSDKLLYSDEGDNYYYTKCINGSKTVLNNVLLERFDPPIRLVYTNRGRFCKINSKSLVNYFQARHCD